MIIKNVGKSGVWKMDNKRFYGYILYDRQKKRFVSGFDFHRRCGFEFTEKNKNKLPKVFSEYEKDRLLREGLPAMYKIKKVEVRILPNDNRKNSVLHDKKEIES